VTLAGTRVGATPDEPSFAGPDPKGSPAPAGTNDEFWLAVTAAAVLGAVIRFVYLFHAAPRGSSDTGFLLTIADGEPRYDTPADVGLVVLAGVCLERLASLSWSPGR
jgi:hypothetical protein